jgi:DNA modification methylase
MTDNLLYYGDNLDILRDHIKDETVDLIYLDPPFKSNQDYNVLFAEQDGSRSAAQIKAFEDTWRWDQSAALAYKDVVEQGPDRVSQAMQAFRTMLGTNDMLAYLAMMAPRLVELHRVLKSTGSIYLHCDPTASHYLKMLMDAVFTPKLFRNEIIWRRTGAHSKARRFAPIHDTIFFYTKSDQFTWNFPKRPYMRGHVEEYFVKDESGWRTNYYGNVLTGSGTRHGESGKPWKGFDPTIKGRHWAVPSRLLEEVDEDLSGLTQHQKLDRLYELGFIHIVEGAEWPIYEHYIKPTDGTPVSDLWTYQPYSRGTVFETDSGIDEDVRWLSPKDQERLGYPTQKPEGVLDRIIQASSDPENIVLDPFCGCGTTIAVAQRLNRRWIGIDVTHLAINLIGYRLKTMFDSEPQLRDRPEERLKYEIKGAPRDVSGAKALADQDRFQFQCWALYLVQARKTDVKRGADKGIDGRLVFHDDNGATKQVVLSVKSGKVSVRDVRDLRGVIEREHAEIGVLITLQEPTDPMRREAAGAGFYNSPWTGKDHPRLQILTIEQLLEGKRIDMPSPEHTSVTFKKAPKAKRKRRHLPNLLF